MALEQEQMKHYLLGDTTKAEAEAIELRLIEDSAMSGQFYVAESELIEDYLEGSLTDAEREMFENHFLVSEERRDRTNEIRLLKRFSSGPHRFDLAAIDRDGVESRVSGRMLIGISLAIMAAIAIAVLVYLKAF